MAGALAPRADLAARIQQLLAAQGGAGHGRGGFRLRALRRAARGWACPTSRALSKQVALLLAQHGLPGRIGARAVSLASDGLSPVQATRALRFALSAFARGGDEALEKAGFSGGLTGFVASAAERATALRRTIAERRFRLAFQPIVLLADRRAAPLRGAAAPHPDPRHALWRGLGIHRPGRDGGPVGDARLGGGRDRLRRGARGDRRAHRLQPVGPVAAIAGLPRPPLRHAGGRARTSRAACWSRSPRPPRSRTRPRRAAPSTRCAPSACPSASTISAPVPPPSATCAPSASIS